jgi:propanol-preferring alcohol dehydrogenase
MSARATMRAMVLERTRGPLVPQVRDVPQPGAGEVLVSVHACGVCRTDLHVVDGDLPRPRLPLVPGHEIVGSVAAVGADVRDFAPGDRVGVPWLARTCGACRYCRSGRENLCDAAAFTGYTVDGGYAEYAAANARFCFRLPDGPSDAAIAPWLCAGLIGYRALRLAGEARRIGLYGFGAAAHMVAQVCRYQQREVFAFTRAGDVEAQRFARELGAAWAGGSDEASPCELDAALLFAPIGALVPKALRDVAKGGSVVCAGIHMSDIPGFAYDALWGERCVRSVANLTRQDGVEFIALAQRAGIESRVSAFPLTAANDALAALRAGRVVGAAVLDVRHEHAA